MKKIIFAVIGCCILTVAFSSPVNAQLGEHTDNVEDNHIKKKGEEQAKANARRAAAAAKAAKAKEDALIQSIVDRLKVKFPNTPDHILKSDVVAIRNAHIAAVSSRSRTGNISWIVDELERANNEGYGNVRGRETRVFDTFADYRSNRVQVDTLNELLNTVLATPDGSPSVNTAPRNSTGSPPSVPIEGKKGNPVGSSNIGENPSPDVTTGEGNDDIDDGPRKPGKDW